MMYPVLAKVRYETVGRHAGDTRLLGRLAGAQLGRRARSSCSRLAWLFLPDLPAYRNGLILIGLARCIAMVLIWNSLACGSSELAAVLVALNSVFQILTYSRAGLALPDGGARLVRRPGRRRCDVSMWDDRQERAALPRRAAARRLPDAALLVARRGEAWYDGVFMPKFGPTALLGLLYTIVLMFAMQGDRILELPMDVLRIAVPLVVYFVVMFGLALPALEAARLRVPGDAPRSPSPRPATTSSSRSRSRSRTFGLASGEALAAVVGPLIEVPALVGTGVRLALGPAFLPAGRSLRGGRRRRGPPAT